MTNPLLSRVKLPGRIFQLPSKGIFYEKGILAETVKEGEVQVKPLSALAEMKLRSADLLFNGRAIREICEECIPDILKPEFLVAKDIDGIFCFLRIVTYGAEMQIRTVHDCNPKDETYTVNIEAVAASPKNECLEHAEELYKINLGNGQIVNLKPVSFQDTLDVSHLRREIDRKMYEDENKQIDSGMLEKLIVRDLMSVIKSVETETDDNKVILVTDRAMIEEWVHSLQKSQVDKIISQTTRAAEWGFDLSVDIKCRHCEETFKYQLELDPINFFSG